MHAFDSAVRKGLRRAEAFGPALLRMIANWGLGLAGLWQCLPERSTAWSERELLALIPEPSRARPRRPRDPRP